MEAWALTKGEEMGLWKSGEMDLVQFRQWIQATEKEWFSSASASASKKKRPAKMRKVDNNNNNNNNNNNKGEDHPSDSGNHIHNHIATKIEATATGKQIEVVAEEIQGIVYYIDAYENVYKPEDILRGVPNPTVLGKYVKVGNTYIVPDLGL